MAVDLASLEKSLWDAADELRANSGLKASEYGTPVLGLIFLRFADVRFRAAHERIEAKASARRRIGPSDYHAAGVIYLTEAARFSSLLDLPEGSDLGRAVNEAMRVIEEHNPDLSGVLPHTYTAIDSATIASLLRHINSYTKDIEGDAFGLVYEYFLGQFAMTEGQKGGEFFTPMSIVRLIVEIIEPYHGRIESYEVEFKSTARWNLREERKDKRMEDAVVKTVAGFLNTDGGTLFIGVDDARAPLGLDHDAAVVKPPNADGLVNWLTTHLVGALGHTAVMRTRARIERVADREICRIDVAQSSAPINARMSGKADVFWVRMNNSTRALPEPEVEVYVRDRW